MARLKFLGVATVTTAFFLLLLSLNQRPVQVYHRSQHSYQYSLLAEDYLTTNSTFSDTIKDVVKQQQTIIEQETFDYPFPLNSKLSNFTPATGGVPFHNIIIATWRSGSTFVGDVINALPGNFYHYEPLLDFGIVQVRGLSLAALAVRRLKRLLNCDYKDLDDYLPFGQTHPYLFSHNTRLWNQCNVYPHYCWNSTFLSEYCKVFPFQSMKVVRIRLRLAEALLKDES